MKRTKCDDCGKVRNCSPVRLWHGETAHLCKECEYDYNLNLKGD